MGHVRITPARITLATFVGAALVYAWLIWHRRWMSDDGLIYLRTVRNILEGNGPVFNAFERAESYTSPLWVWVLAGLGSVTGHLSLLAVVTGGVLSLASLVIGMDATRRLIRTHGSRGPIVPAGALVMIGAFPFWDFATSGLEGGLACAWFATCWWLLVTLDARRVLVTAIVVGLGPLVRPELAVATLVFLVAVCLLERPGWKRGLGLVMAALALPLAYEVFRAGYFGTLVPLPALAKNATDAHWHRGFTYLLDTVRPCWLWLPGCVLVAVFALRLEGLTRRERIVIAAPAIVGLLLTWYVVRVGGDFMHARMLLLPAFALLLPAFVLPLDRVTSLAVVVLVAWTIATVWHVGDGKSHVTVAHGIEDERVGYVHWTRRKHPIKPEAFVAADIASPTAANALRDGQRRFIWQYGSLPMNPSVRGPIVFVAARLGTAGYVAPLDAIVADSLGLAHPLGARITVTKPGFAGHEKELPWAWLAADFADPAVDGAPALETPACAVRAARHAMQCGELAELLLSTRAPMTASRFWSNLTGSFARTRLVIPSDPIEAEREFCGDGPPCSR